MEKKSIRFISALALMMLLLVGVGAPQVQAGRNEAYMYRGVNRVMSSPLAIPSEMVNSSRRMPFPIGIIAGTVKGVVKATTGIVFGALDLAVGVAPYAKYALLA